MSAPDYISSGGPSRSVSLSLTSTTPIPASTSRNNPLSLRIYKAIGTTFDDEASREALEVASSLYAGKGKGKATSPPEEHQVNGVATSDDDDLALEWGLQRRAAQGESAAMARKWLKRDVESKMADGSQKFLEAFGEVDKQQKLNVLREHMKDMQIRCDQVQAELDQANSGTKHLLEKADGLREQRATAQMKLQLVTLFLARFTLSEEEQKALTSWDVGLNQTLFDALDHVITIRKDCEVLLSGEEEKMQAGLDIMAVTSEQMESGYKKIHRWCQFEFRQFTKEGHVEVSPVMREAIQRLRQRPALLDDALSNLTSTRQSSLLNSFLEALTRGGPNGLPRPIELHAHDPIRYVGDMLAWVHQATASEHEFLEGLFGVKEKKRMMGSARLRDAELDVEEAMVREALDKDLEGLSRPLKMRIQQTVKSQEGLITAYKIANLLQFYLVTMRRTIGEDARLCKTIQQIYEQANEAFFETLDAQGRSLLRFLHPPDATLSPPLALRDSCQILRELIEVYESSLVDPTDRPADSDFSKLLEKAVDPAVEMCERMADLRKSTGGAGDNWDKDIFLINCLTYIKQTLQAYPFTEERSEMLEKKIQQHFESMTFEHHGKLLEQSGLAPIMKTIHNRPADTPLSRLPSASSKLVTQALSTFTNFLNTIDVLTSPRLALLTPRALAELIHRTALKRISEAYGEICDRVLDKKEGYEFAETLLRRGKDEVAVALGVDNTE